MALAPGYGAKLMLQRIKTGISKKKNLRFSHVVFGKDERRALHITSGLHADVAWVEEEEGTSEPLGCT